ncbi:mov10 RISC complex RNA helicase isoform 1-T2 [Glossina fuscipes fuscipes]
MGSAISSAIRSVASTVGRFFSGSKRNSSYNYASNASTSSRSEPYSSGYIRTVSPVYPPDNSRDKKIIRKFTVLYPLSFYPPSTAMKSSLDQNFSVTSLKTSSPVMSAYLEDYYLHSENIHIIFRYLLEIEDLTVMSQYPALQQKDVIIHSTGDKENREFMVKLNNTDNDINEIVDPFMDEVVVVPKYSAVSTGKIDVLLPHLHEQLRGNENLFRRSGVITSISKDVLRFRFNFDQNSKLLRVNDNEKYNLIIRPMRMPLRYQYRALELLTRDRAIRQYLFPVEKSKNLLENPTRNRNERTHLSLFNRSIFENPEQLQAVNRIVNYENLFAPYIIFGPPGTGKTTTVVETILQLYVRRLSTRILVTSSSNSACDTIASGICKNINRNILYRNQSNLLLRLFSGSALANGVNAIDPEVLKRSNCKGGSHYYPAIEDIRMYSIIVTTLCLVGKLVSGGIGAGGFFTHIFIDEAGACSEPEALVGIMDVKSPKCEIILSGDHKQLGPVFKSERAAELGLSKSLMERLLERKCYSLDEWGNYDRTLQFRLNQNYRCHPKILGLFNHLYYDNKLQAKAKPSDVNVAAKWDKLPNANFPIIFQAVFGRTEKDKRSGSCFNNRELQVSMELLESLLITGIDGRQVEQTDIAIISPYKQQCERIKKQLREKQWTDVEIGTVNSFQGREKHIVIISLVRSFTSLGFVDEPKRLNVMLSRAKSLLIIIGNPGTLRRSADLKYILDECSNNGTFVNNEKKETPKHIKQRQRRNYQNKNNLQGNIS